MLMFSSTAMCAHFFQIHIARQEQWTNLGVVLDRFGSQHGILLADHNSLILPVRDAKTLLDEELEASIDARDAEILALAKLGLKDTWWKVHHYAKQAHYHCSVYTFGHYVQDDESQPKPTVI